MKIVKSFEWKYEGDIVNMQRTGKGTCTWTDGDTYDGYWQQDKMHGSGIYRYEGARWKGELFEDAVYEVMFVCTEQAA
jgi:hypothetical protein